MTWAASAVRSLKTGSLACSAPCMTPSSSLCPAITLRSSCAGVAALCHCGRQLMCGYSWQHPAALPGLVSAGAVQVMGILAAMTFVRFGLEPLMRLIRRLFMAPGSWEKSAEYFILREVPQLLARAI